MFYSGRPQSLDNLMQRWVSFRSRVCERDGARKVRGNLTISSNEYSLIIYSGNYLSKHYLP
jgi:hypothetical protein